MKSYFERLVEERGEAEARAYMRELRAKRVNNIGGGFRNETTRTKATEARKKNAIRNKRLTSNPK